MRRRRKDTWELHVAPGHHYSPIPSPDDVARAVARAGLAEQSLPGIDLREAEQLRLLESLLPLYADLPFADTPNGHRFHYANTWFMHADAICYALLLRHLRPSSVIEVGCGYSSALALDVDELFLDGRTAFTFIEPDAERLRAVTRPGDLDGRLIETIVQAVPLSVFERLESGDILFIDSSHVLKAGSDVQFLVDEVLPRLAPGVHVHVHDVFYPFEYPESWLRSGVAFNEAYAVRALLQGSDAFRVVLFDSMLERTQRAWLEEHMPLMLASEHPTGSIWLERL